MSSTERPAFPFNRLPIRTRRGIPFYIDKSPAAFRADPYEQYDPMVVRQTALHLVAAWWPEYPWQAVLDWVMERIPDRASGFALDIGCGVGRLIGEVARRHPDWRCYGLDYSYQLLRQARQYWCTDIPLELDASSRGFGPIELPGYQLSNLEFALADAQRLPLRSDSLDLLIASCLVDRLPAPLEALREWRRVLRSDGRLLLVTPGNFQRAEHWRAFYPPERWASALTGQGWHIAESRTFQILEPLDRSGNAVRWVMRGYCLVVSP